MIYPRERKENALEGRREVGRSPPRQTEVVWHRTRMAGSPPFNNSVLLILVRAPKRHYNTGSVSEEQRSFFAGKNRQTIFSMAYCVRLTEN